MRIVRIVGSIANPWSVTPYVLLLADGWEIPVTSARYWRAERALEKRAA